MSRQVLGANLFDLEELPTSSNLSLLINRVTTALKSQCDVRVFRADRDRIKLDAEGIEVDVLEFLSLLKLADREFEPSRKGFVLVQALSLVQGDLLPDLEHPLITPIRARMRGAALNALLDLAHTPIAGDYRGFLLEILAKLDPLARNDPDLVGTLLKVYAQLGLRDQVLQVFSDYEDWLDEEFGEPPSRELVDLLERLIGEISSRSRPKPTVAPPKPEITVGRERILGEILDFATDCGKGGVLTLAGLSGIGKSHLLAEAFWRLDGNVRVQLIDYEVFHQRAIRDRLLELQTDCLLIDHAHLVPAELLQGVIKQFPEVRLILACHAGVGLAGERLLHVPPLELGSNNSAAVELLQFHARRQLSATLLPELQQSQDFSVVAAMCDGIPLALEIAGKLLATLGFQGTIQALRSSLRKGGSFTDTVERHQSVRQAILASFSQLSPEAKALVRGMSWFRTKMYAGLALSAFECAPETLQEAYLSGLVRREEDSPIFSVFDSTAYYLCEEQSAVPSGPMFLASRRIRQWFAAQAQMPTVDLRIARCLGSAMTALRRLAESEDFESALGLVADLRPWMGSECVAVEDIRYVESLVRHPEAVKSSSWPGALLAVCALMFHANMYPEMDALLSDPSAEERFASEEPTLRINHQIQLGIAKRNCGDYESASNHLLLAVNAAEEAKSDSLLVKSCFNLASLYENRGRYEEALDRYVQASRALGAGIDIRLEHLVNMSIVRLRQYLGEDLEGICLQYEALLMHAMESNDRRISAEILQGLGIAYADRGMNHKASLSLVIGSALFLDFGYTQDFRRHMKSTFVVLGCCFFELGAADLGYRSRVMVDRLGPTAVYAPLQPYFERLQERTYRSVDELQHGIASEEEVSSLLAACYQSLIAEREELPLFLEAHERLAQARFLA